MSGGKIRRHFNDHLHAKTLISPSDLLFPPLGAVLIATGRKMKLYLCQIENNLICTKGKTKGIIRFLYSYERTYTTDASEFTSIYVVFFNFIFPVLLCVNKC